MNIRKSLIVLTSLFLLTGCSASEKSSAPKKEGTKKKEAEKEEVLENDNFKIDGVYLDTNDATSDESLKYLYIFYTYEPKSENLSISSSTASLKIDGNYQYSSDTHQGAGKYMSDYYYSSTIKDVYGGSTLKALVTFEVPLQQVESAKKLTFLPYGVKEGKEITFKGADVQKLDNAEAIAQKADPDGYSAYQTAYQEADEATTNTVRGYLNGYKWDFFVNNTSYELEFYEPNQFEMRALGGANDGSYTVRNGYVTIVYDSNNYTVDIPYTIENNEINLDVTTAFDVQQ